MELFPTTVEIKSDLSTGGYSSQNSPSLPRQPAIPQNNPFKGDQVTISGEAKKKHSFLQSDPEKNFAPEDSPDLTNHDLAQLRTLKRRDVEVRNHEQAHLSAAGKFAKGGASFVYQKGPDGGSYAIGGEVSIDVSAESSPEATIAKMQTIKRAALAPLNPSAADRGIAAQAASKEATARQQLIKEQHERLATENKLQSWKSDLFIQSEPHESVSNFNTVA